MSVRKIIDDVIETLPSNVTVDQKIACEKILKAEKIVFLDTCFLSNMKKIDKNTREEMLRTINKDGETIVFVITELVLYEASDLRVNCVQPYVVELVNSVVESGSDVVVLCEDTTAAFFSQYVSRNVEWWNSTFFNRVIENRMFLNKTAGLMQSLTKCVGGEARLTTTNRKDASFIPRIIAAIKETKENKDSLAEQLICVVMFFLYEGFNFSNKSIYFCSVDNAALASVRHAIVNSYDKNQIHYENIHFFLLLQYMVQQGLVTDKEKLLSYMKKTLPDFVCVVERKKLPFQEMEEVLTLEQITEGLFEGKTYHFRGNGKSSKK